jgi:hypothetical protein
MKHPCLRMASRSPMSRWDGHSRCGRTTGRADHTDLAGAPFPNSTITKVPRTNSNDFNPMWTGDRVYFLSTETVRYAFLLRHQDQSGARSGCRAGLDLKSAGLGPDAIVYEQFGGLHLYDLKTGSPMRFPSVCRATCRNCVRAW